MGKGEEIIFALTPSFCYHLPMDFERCFGCPGGKCPAAEFFKALETGALQRADFVDRTQEGSIMVDCGGVTCGFGAKATIVFEAP